jgi:hypothetical protein
MQDTILLVTSFQQVGYVSMYDIRRSKAFISRFPIAFDGVNKASPTTWISCSPDGCWLVMWSRHSLPQVWDLTTLSFSHV